MLFAPLPLIEFRRGVPGCLCLFIAPVVDSFFPEGETYRLNGELLLFKSFELDSCLSSIR